MVDASRAALRSGHNLLSAGGTGSGKAKDATAASSARRNADPASGVSRPRTTTIPSSSTQVRSVRSACRSRSSSCSAARSVRRRSHARTTRSTWAAVPASATSSSAC